MPAAKSNPINELLAKRNLREETREKKAEAPKAGSNLPPGIEGGVARVTMIKFPVAKTGTYQGKPMLYSQATLIEPKEVEVFNSEGKSLGMRQIEGANVQFQSINICDTTSDYGDRTLEENWARAENHLKLLGIPTEDVDDENFTEAVCGYPETEDLFVRFRTWSQDPDKDNPNPRTNVVLEGPAEGYVQELVDDMDDDTEEAPAKPAPKAKAKPTPKPSPKPKAAAKPAPKTKPKAKAADAEPDLDALAASADDDDDADAQEELSRLAKEAGVDIDDVETWTEGAEIIKAAKSEGGDDYEDATDEEEEEEEAAPIEVKKDDIVVYTPPGKGKKPVECEVVRVIKGNRTANLVELDDDSNEYKNVSWDKLAHSE